MVDVVDSGLMLSNRKYFAVINKAFCAVPCVEVNCYSISKNVNTTDLFTENVFFLRTTIIAVFIVYTMNTTVHNSNVVIVGI